MFNELGDLTDPTKYQEPLNIEGEQTTRLMEELRLMLTIRRAEEKIGEQVLQGAIRCPCHLAIGQEAIAAGVARHLTSTDRAFGTHRSHSHYLAMGGDLFELFSEVLGKATGCSHGMGGSMHLWAEDKGFKGSVPIVAGTVSLAVGAGLAAQMDAHRSQDISDVGVAFFGDGAAEEGSVHESLNMAQVMKLPVLFVCENNLFSSHLHIRLRQPSDRVARFAEAHKMHCEVVDGNDVVAVARATEKLLARARRGEGPGFLEAVTYRWRGHVGPSEDNDVGLKRGEELLVWKKRDPVRRLQEALLQSSQVNAAELEELAQKVNKQVETAWSMAAHAPFPEHENLLGKVYAPPHPKEHGNDLLR